MGSHITDFDVTYGEALAPPGFSRATRRDKELSANINAGAGGVGQAYLWYHRGANRGAPVVAVDVIYNDEPVPPGFVKVARDMCKGSSRSSYLCFRRQADPGDVSGSSDSSSGIDTDTEDGDRDHGTAGEARERPLAEVVIAAQDEDPGEGFVRLEKPLCKGDSPLFLCYKRASAAGDGAGGQPWSPSSLKVGDLVDVKDATYGRWVVAQVMMVNDGVLSVQSRDPSAGRWDEELPLTSQRLAAVGMHTGGGDGAARSPLASGAGAGGVAGTGVLGPAPGTMWHVTREELQAVGSRLEEVGQALAAAAAEAGIALDDDNEEEEEEEEEAEDGDDGGAEKDEEGQEGAAGATTLAVFLPSSPAQGPALRADHPAWLACLQELPAFLEQALASAYPSEDAVGWALEALVPAYALLARALRVCPPREPLPPPLARALALAFGAEGSYFFEHHGHGQDVAAALLDPATQPVHFSLPSSSTAARGGRNNNRDGGSLASVFALFLLNRFVDAGGFAAMMHRVRHGAPLVEVAGQLALLERTYPHYVHTDFGPVVMKAVQGPVLRRAALATDAELGAAKQGGGGGGDRGGGGGEPIETVEREAFRLLNFWYKDAGGGSGGQAEFHGVQERYSLRQAWRYATCPYLNMRIRGLSHINELADMALRRDSLASRRYGGGGMSGGWYGGGGGGGRDQQNATKWMTLEYLLRWVVKARVVEVVLGQPAALAAYGLGDTHYELIRRVETLLGLLADKGLLGPQHVDALWAAATAQQASDTQVRAVYKLVERVAPKLSLELLGAVHDRLKRDLPLPYEAQHVELIRTVAEAAIQHQEEQPKMDPLGSMLLWEAVLGRTDEVARPVPESDDESDPSPAPPGLPAVQPGEQLMKREVVDQASEAVVGLIQQQGNVDVLARFLRRCIRCVRDGRRVVPALYMLVKVSERMPVTAPYQNVGPNGVQVARAQVWKYVDKMAVGTGGIHGTVIENLREYRERARAVARARGLLPPADRDAEDGREEEKEEPGAEDEKSEEQQKAEDAALLDAHLVDGGYGLSYGEEVQTRLHFLRYAADCGEGPVKLAYGPHLVPLWEMLVGDALCPTERSMFLEWLTNLVPAERGLGAAGTGVGGVGGGGGGAGVSCISQATARDLFHDCLARTPDGTAADAAEDAMAVEAEQSGGSGSGGDGTVRPFVGVAKLGRAGYECLERYFRAVNHWDGRISSPVGPGGLVVRDFVGLDGLDAIWHAYWHGGSAAVSQAAGAFLIDLHLRLQPRDAKGTHRADVWAALVGHCRDVVMAATAANDQHQHQHQQSHQQQAQSTRAVARALRLLRLFFEELQQPRRDSGVPEYRAGPDEVEVCLEVRRLEAGSASYGPVSRELRYYFKDAATTLGQLRARVAADAGTRATQVRLLSASHQILQSDQADDLTIQHHPAAGGYGAAAAHQAPQRYHAVLLPRPERDTVDADPAAAPAVSLDQGPEERRAPLQALGEDRAFFEQVFALAAASPAALVPDASALLDMVPEIGWIEAAIRTLGGALPSPSSSSSTAAADSGSSSGSSSGSIATWGALLHGEAPIRFYYNLRLISKILAPVTDPYAPAAERAEASRWELAFVKMGGLAYLLHVLAAWDLEAPSGAPALAKATLSALIHRMAAFLPPGKEVGSSLLGGSNRAGGASGGQRGHMPTSSTSSLFLMGLAEDGAAGAGGAGPGSNGVHEEGFPILAGVNLDDDADDEPQPQQQQQDEFHPAREEEGEDASAAATAHQQAAVRRRVLRASARVFARVDRRALTARLLDVLYEVLKSAKDGPTVVLSAAAGSTAGEEGDDAASGTEEGRMIVPAGAVAGRSLGSSGGGGNTTPRGGASSRRNSLSGGGGGGFLRGARDLLRRPSWVNQNEWTGDLFADDESAPSSRSQQQQQQQPQPQSSQSASEDVALAQASLGLLVTLGAGGPGLLDVVLGAQHFSDLLRFGLLLAPDEEVRRAVARGLHRLCVEGRRRRQRQEEERRRRQREQGGGADEDEDDDEEEAAGTGQDPVRGLVAALIGLLDRVGEDEEAAVSEEGGGGGGCIEYFKLLTRLIKAPHALADVDPTALAVTLAGRIVRRRVVEASEQEEDKVLQGLLTALRALLAFLPQRDGVPRRVKAAVGGGDVGLLRELFDRCLFAMPAAGGGGGKAEEKGQAAEAAAAAAAEAVPLPKCKHPTTRNLALGLVLELSADCPENFGEVVAVLAKHNPLGVAPAERERRRQRLQRKRRSQMQAQWGRRRSGSLGGSMGGAPMVLAAAPGSAAAAMQLGLSKSRTGYVGLKNLGCICYMNSTVQQLFHVKGFRAGVLAFEDEVTGRGSEEEREGSLMYQLQSLFAHLQETDKAYYNPKGLCQAYRTSDGEPTDVFVQMDASEFLTNLFQQLEAIMQGSKCEGVLREHFGATMLHELIAEGGRYKARAATEYFFSVQVQNQGSLQQALTSYFAGEVLTDYSWESKDAAGKEVKTQVPTTKRISLSALPPHLIVHVKRFEFDFETLQQVKLNDRFEFPEELDMLPYTIHGRAGEEGEDEAELACRRAWRQREGGTVAAADEAPPACTKYRLAGVVVHMGTANSGHYYSYIRERGGTGERWFEFNDTVVVPFDPADLEVECFGGQESGGNGRWARERTRNAFLLVYDRADVDAAARTIATTTATATSGKNGGGGGGKKGVAASTTTSSSGGGVGGGGRPRVPAAIMEEITRENVEFWRRTHILTRHYFEFMEALLEPVVRPSAEERELQQEDPRHQALLAEGLRLATRFTLGTLFEAQDWEGVNAWVPRLQRAYARSPAGRAWLLQAMAAEGAEGSGGLLWELLVETEEQAGRLAVVDLVEHAATATLEEAEATGSTDGRAEALCLDLVRALLRLRGRLLQSCQQHNSQHQQQQQQQQQQQPMNSSNNTAGAASSSSSVVVPPGRADCYVLLLGGLLKRMEAARRLALEEEHCLLDLLLLADEVATHMDASGGSGGGGGDNETKPAAADPNNNSSSGGAGEGEGARQLQPFVIVGELLTALLRGCVIPGCGAGAVSPLALPPYHQLSPEEAAVVCSAGFAARVVGLVSAASAKARLRPLVTHLLHENRTQSHEFLQAIAAGIGGGSPGNAGSGSGSENAAVGSGSGSAEGGMKACFRALMLALGVEDSLQRVRVEEGMKGAMTALATQSCFYRATELGLAMLMRLARENALVRHWFREGAASPPPSPERAHPPPTTATAASAAATGGGQHQQQPQGGKKGHQPTRSGSSGALSAMLYRATGGVMGANPNAVPSPTNRGSTGGGGGGAVASDGAAGAGSGEHGEAAETVILSRPEARWAEEWLVTHQPSGSRSASSSYDGGSDGFAAAGNWMVGGGRAGGGKNAAAGGGGGGVGGIASNLRLQRMLKGVRSLAKGRALPLDYDSDMDPREIVGRGISIRWARDEYYSGIISHYSPRSRMHHVRYDDGDERDHNLSEKVFTFLPDRCPPPHGEEEEEGPNRGSEDV